MATSWPQQSTWPTELREHATRLSTYLQDTLVCIERTDNQPVPAELVKTIIHGTVTFILKTQHTPDLNTVHDALRIAKTEAKATADHTAQALHDLKKELENTTEAIRQSAAITQQNMNIGEEARAAAKEAAEAGKVVIEKTREMHIRGMQNQASGPASYAAAAVRGQTLAGIHNIQSPRAPPVQTQREIVVNIRNPLTIQNLRAMNPRNLKAYVEQAIEQSGNDNITSIKIVSSNQLKSGDLSIRTANNSETEALRQFADDWAHRIGSGATVRNPTYGVLAHGIRTNTLDMDKFEENRSQMLQDNRPFIPQAEIKYIGWLTRSAPNKSASTIIIEFARPEDANKIIDEGLIWQGECKATTACGYCAQEHNSRDCPSKVDRGVPKKCVTCRGEHEAWNRHCPTRKEELAKAKAAYDIRPHYHPVPVATGGTTQPGGTPSSTQGSRPSQNPTSIREAQMARNRSQSRRGQKRTNTGNTIDNGDKENQLGRENSSQRPQRHIIPSRRALEAIENNTQVMRWSSQQMDVDPETNA
ncbi:hypothetical protein B0J11DRAFT_498685 [Dendryphion nanum]|uniref:Uncharacterized protein n=1 Tax=Dendryphion nanum TaxID=256645 RepID=A0A9P9D2K7_9PLEO|nr:hypothetical protein B0J11DRAFT_498685 [Dendryphion nanum]